MQGAGSRCSAMANASHLRTALSLIWVKHSLSEEEMQKFTQIADNVDAIVRNWDSYQPTDPLLIMIKRSIDGIEAQFNE